MRQVEIGKKALSCVLAVLLVMAALAPMSAFAEGVSEEETATTSTTQEVETKDAREELAQDKDNSTSKATPSVICTDENVQERETKTAFVSIAEKTCTVEVYPYQDIEPVYGYGHPNGQSDMYTIECVEGSKITSPQTPIRSGYYFLGWKEHPYLYSLPYLSFDSGITAYSGMKIFGWWVPQGTVIFSAGHGLEDVVYHIDPNEVIAAPEYSVAPDGYVFDKWYISTNNYGGIYLPDFNKPLYALSDVDTSRGVFSAKEQTWTIRSEWHKDIDVVFNPQNGSASTTKVLRLGDASSAYIDPPQVSSPLGKKFLGWFDAPSGGKQVSYPRTYGYASSVFARNLDLPEGMQTNPINLYAQYEGGLNTTSTFYLTFKPQNGDEDVVVTLSPGTYNVSNLWPGVYPSPAQSGLNFNGWYTGPTFGEKATTITITNQDITLYAQYQISTVTIFYDVTESNKIVYDSMIPSQRYNIGDVATPPVPSTDWESCPGDNYVFDGWYYLPDDVPTNLDDLYLQEKWDFSSPLPTVSPAGRDGHWVLIVVGRWVIKQHEVVFFHDGSAIDIQEVDHGTQAQEVATPMEPESAVDAWYTAPVFGEKWDFKTPVTDNVALYSHVTPLEDQVDGGDQTPLPDESESTSTPVLEPPTASEEPTPTVGKGSPDEEMNAVDATPSADTTNTVNKGDIPKTGDRITLLPILMLLVVSGVSVAVLVVQHKKTKKEEV